MNGFAALDIHPHRRYVVDIGGRRSSRCRLHINFALFLHSLDFTQNLGLTRILKTECIYRHKPETFDQANKMIDDYIYFYNHERIQLKTGLAPLALRQSC